MLRRTMADDDDASGFGGRFSRTVPAAGLLLRGVLQPVRRGVTVRSSTYGWNHATREGLPLVEYNAGKPLFPRGPRWPESRWGTWQARRFTPPLSFSHRRAAQAHLRGRGIHPSDPQAGGSAPLKPHVLVQYHAASVDEARASVPLYEEAEDVIYRNEDEDEEVTRCGTMNNGQCSRRPNWGGRRMLFAGLLSTVGRLLRAADMDGRERESGEPPVTGGGERDRGGCGAVRRWVTVGTTPRLVCQVAKGRRLRVALCESVRERV
jgi:hypothetical protein